MTKPTDRALLLLSLGTSLLAGVGCRNNASNTAAQGDERGRLVFQQRCAACHGLNAEGGQGPSLKGVVGRKAAAAPGFPYTEALKSSGLTWDTATLDRFLAAPMNVVPGTTMLFNVPSSQERSAVIAYLGTLKGTATP